MGTLTQEGVGNEGHRPVRLIAYQALLSNPASAARVQALKRAIERAGGRVSIAPPTREGMVLVILEMPDGVMPEQFFPDMPFYPV